MKTWFSKQSKKTLWVILIVIFALVVVGGGYLYYRSTQTTENISSEPVLQTTKVRQGDLVLVATGTGTVIPIAELDFGFSTGGQVTQVLVSLGEEVQSGQILATVDSTSQELKLTQARSDLLELTSPLALANAWQSVIQAQENLEDAQNIRYNLNYEVKQTAIENAYADVVLAKTKLDKAQENYDKVSDLSVDDSRRANAYASLYDAQAAYDSTYRNWDYYNNYSVTPAEIEAADADVALAQAKLTEAQHLLAALRGDEVPVDATGSGLVKLKQAQLSVTSAQDDLDATELTAPIAGTIMTIKAQIGQSVGSGTVMTIADLNQPYLEIFLDQSDWDKIEVGYDVEVIFDAFPDKLFTGHIVLVEPGLVSIANTLVVKGYVLLDTSSEIVELPVGLDAAVDVIGGRAEGAILVPIEALHESSPGVYTLFVMENGTPKLRKVEIGIKDIYYAEVLSGLEVGEIVTTGIVETE